MAAVTAAGALGELGQGVELQDATGGLDGLDLVGRSVEGVAAAVSQTLHHFCVESLNNYNYDQKKDQVSACWQQRMGPQRCQVVIRHS